MKATTGTKTEQVRLALTDGNATVDGTPVEPVAGLTPEQAAIAVVARLAAERGRPVRALADDGDEQTALVVHADGRSEPEDAPAQDAEAGGEVEASAAAPTTPTVAAPTRPAARAASPSVPVETSDLRHASRHGRPQAADLMGDPTGEQRPARAREGWRGALVRSLRLPLAPGAGEVALHADLRAAQAQLPGPATVMVVNPKGGVGKTTSTLLLAAALGVARGGGVLAWDNNETRGTMALRSADASHGGDVRTLLAAAADLTSAAGRLGDLDAHVHHQAGVRFDVLPSEADPTGTGIVDGDDFAALHALLTRFYRVLLVDTGNNIRSANWRAAADAAGQLVITTTVREDSATSAAWMLDALADGPHAHLLPGAVTLLHDPAPRTSDRLRRRLADHFAAATDDADGARVIPMPYEPSLAAGGRIDHEALTRAGQRAWLRAAAAVVDQLAAPAQART